MIIRKTYVQAWSTFYYTWWTLSLGSIPLRIIYSVWWKFQSFASYSKLSSDITDLQKKKQKYNAQNFHISIVCFLASDFSVIWSRLVYWSTASIFGVWRNWYQTLVYTWKIILASVIIMSWQQNYMVMLINIDWLVFVVCICSEPHVLAVHIWHWQPHSVTESYRCMQQDPATCPVSPHTHRHIAQLTPSHW